MTKRETVFRQNALNQGSPQWLGNVRVASPPSHATWAAGFLVLAIIICSVLYFGEYTRRERVVGQLVSLGGIVRITSTTSGYVSHLKVSEGDHVPFRAPILKVNNETYAEDGVGIKQAKSISLQRERKAIKRDIESSRDTATNRISSIEQQLLLLDAKLINATAELDIYKTEVEAQKELLAKIESLLDQAYVSTLQAQQQRSTLASARAKVGQQLSEISSIRMDASKLRAELKQVPLDLAMKLNASERLIAETDAQSRSVEGERSFTILSPIEGTISSVLISEGQSIKPGQTLMTIVRESAEIEAQLLVDSDSIGFVSPGTKVALRLRAFPFQKFGVLMGSVKRQSLTPLTPEEAATRLGVSSPQESMYLVRIGLSRQSIDIYGRAEKLTPGMYVDADVLLDRRRIFEWMFKPAYTLQMKGK